MDFKKAASIMKTLLPAMEEKEKKLWATKFSKALRQDKTAQSDIINYITHHQRKDEKLITIGPKAEQFENKLNEALGLLNELKRTTVM